MILLVVVAHPDDEAVWAGGILAALVPRFRVLIVSATHAGTPQRAAEFRRACSELGAESIMMDCRDGGNEELPAITSQIEGLLADREIDPDSLASVLTHSPSGEEHWHPQHIQLHWQVSNWARKKRLDFCFFSCHPGISSFSQAFTWGIPLVRLVGSKPKKYLARECLRFARCLWRYRSHDMIKVAVDRESKRKLLAIYDAQSLKDYAAYTSPYEFLFTKNPGIIGALAESRNEEASQ
jgi:LmbE family N-acetylglucosaminyl deacetylase